ncbi:F-box/WD repeat-containing protein 8 isoform X3 [Stegostoma tigrinum]|uniref:F-box/WD repeat-containing protein 8 isoform X3 n=1 Tax=Stegostoma tigrinum TaxID=3053191 RepID=UPI00202B1CB6|nr:F-box/WD repeat-containing protein 8 isoform X3 [Stegostoma tigrinum]
MLRLYISTRRRLNRGTGATGECLRAVRAVEVGSFAPQLSFSSFWVWRMGDKELEKFRLLWREEIRERNRAGRLTCGERSSKKRRQQPGPCDHGDRVAVEGPSGRQRAGAAHDYFHLAQSLLEGRSSPLRERLEDGRCGGLSGVVGRGGTGTGSEAWAGPQGQSTQDPSNKKENLLDQLINDLNRIGAASQLQYDVGGILCDAHSCNGLVVSGYTSGDVRMWDISTWDSNALYLETSQSSAELGPRPHVSFVRINSTIAVAAYKGGAVDVWSTVLAQEPVHHYQHSQEIEAVAIASDNAVIATCSGYQVRLEACDEKGYWRTAEQFELQKLASYLQLVPGGPLNTAGSQPVIAAAEDTVYLLNPDAEPKVLHSIYGNTVTCLDVSTNQLACGVKSFGWIISHGNKVQVYCLQTAQPLATLGNSAGDFTCVNLKDSPPFLAVTGNKDRRVRVYDLRTSKAVMSFYGHQLGVSSVQMDDWKIVSGGEEGLVCVWEQRMGAKLWEMHSRHPVRHLRFGTHTLVTANIPNEKCPRGASIMDDDLTAHRRHRGIIYVYDFSVDKSAPVLPICRSTYDEDVGYSYNIALSMPYDQIK